MNESQRASKQEAPTSALVALPSRAGHASRLMIASELEPERARWAQRTERIGLVSAAHASGLEEAGDLARRGAVALALVSAAHSQRGELIASLAELGVGAVVIAGRITAELAIEVMREGAMDLLSETQAEAETTGRIVEAARQSGSRVRRSPLAAASEEHAPGELPTARLASVCRTLNDARNEVADQVGEMCDDLVKAYEQIASQMERVRVASEFGAIARQELELEELLRISLEYILAKVGSTNAALYLPASTGEYSLSAYVNYDCPRDSGETMMEHLADAVPAALEDRQGIVVLQDEDAFAALLGDHGRWLSGHGGAGFACHDEQGECLAVALLFRDQRHPFTDESVRMLEAIAPVLAEQLSRIVRVHCRHESVAKDLGFVDECDGPLPFDDADDDLGWDDLDLAA